METIQNTKTISEIITETANLKGAGTITRQGDKLIELSIRFIDKTKAGVTGPGMGMPGVDLKGFISYKTSVDGSTEKANIMMDGINYGYRQEVRAELNRLLDKYDGVTVITDEA